MGKKYSDKTKNKEPYYINNGGKVEKAPKEEQLPNEFSAGKYNKPKPVPKFRLGIDVNNNPIVTIDNTIHFMSNNQFHAFTLGCIKINKKINPEIDYTSILIEK